MYVPWFDLCMPATALSAMPELCMDGGACTASSEAGLAVDVEDFWQTSCCFLLTRKRSLNRAIVTDAGAPTTEMTSRVVVSEGSLDPVKQARNTRLVEMWSKGAERGFVVSGEVGGVVRRERYNSGGHHRHHIVFRMVDGLLRIRISQSKSTNVGRERYEM